MKLTDWSIFWVCLTLILVVAMFFGNKRQPSINAETECAKNGGIPKYEWGSMVDCDLYLATPTPGEKV